MRHKENKHVQQLHSTMFHHRCEFYSKIKHRLGHTYLATSPPYLLLDNFYSDILLCCFKIGRCSALRTDKGQTQHKSGISFILEFLTHLQVRNSLSMPWEKGWCPAWLKQRRPPPQSRRLWRGCENLSELWRFWEPSNRAGFPLWYVPFAWQTCLCWKEPTVLKQSVADKLFTSVFLLCNPKMVEWGKTRNFQGNYKHFGQKLFSFIRSFKLIEFMLSTVWDVQSSALFTLYKSRFQTNIL